MNPLNFSNALAACQKFTGKAVIIGAILISSILVASIPVNAETQQVMGQTFSQALAEKVLQKAAEETGLPISELEIKSAEFVRWPNSCMGIQAPGQRCFQVIIPGWKVVIATKQYELTYHTNNSTALLAEKTFLEIPQDKHPHPKPKDNFVPPNLSDPVFLQPEPSPSSPQSIPEPSFILGLMTFGGLGWCSRGRSKHNKA
ncbi:hypothetical protein NG791_27905 [Laspinema sp. D1]|uniref:hypothetical protein n=1 Tax=Laspinema palackyanum TaxID=3231601 RepID=UPI00348105BA|nr:hypothetical protein [Laspinema sp. D2b]